MGMKRDPNHNSPMVLFIVKTKRLECPYGLKGKLQLIKCSLVRFSLCHTRHYRIDRLLLHFHATSTMMPHAPSVVAPSPVMRQNWEMIVWLALRQSKPMDVDACPHTIFIRSSVFRCKPTNLLPLSFEAQTKKLSQWFWEQTVDKPSPPVLSLSRKTHTSCLLHV
jgi:hypothetical protein